MSQTPTTDQIRHAIDSGATGEKVAFPDPAAAPLGTDAEAGGNSPTRQERAMEVRAQPEHAEPVKPNGAVVYFALVGIVAMAIVLMWALLF